MMMALRFICHCSSYRRMPSSRAITYVPKGDLTAEQARDARARAWAYAFQCFHSRASKEGGAPTAPDNTRGKSKNDSRIEPRIP